jgi:hypothetical protein
MPEEPRPPDEAHPAAEPTPEEVHHPDGRIEHPSVRRERTDLNFKAIMWILVGALVLGAVVHYAILLFYRDYQHYQAGIKKSPYPLAPTPSTALPPEPRLEPLDRVEGIESSDVYLRQVRREEILSTYGPAEEEGFVHIPVERAVRLLENKLPARPELPAAQARRENGLVDAGASNSGRMFRGKPRWYEP